MSIYNYLKTRAAKLQFFLEKYSGLLWVRTNPLNTPLDLTHQEQPAEKTKKNIERQYKKLEGLTRASPEKIKAALLLNRFNSFGYYNKETKEFVYTSEAKNELDKLFKDYCTRVKLETIILSRAPDGNPVFSQDIELPYKTRFTDPGRKKANIEGFRAVYKKASSRHMKGVFLTLTASPDRANTLWQANKGTIQAWSKFSDFLRYHLPERAELIKVAEFQKNGRIHFHVLIFGINWLLHKSVIQYTWIKYGGGPILDIHAIKQDPAFGWSWSRGRPLDAAGMAPKDYLESYLEKSMSMNGGSMYWVMGVRNWTASKTLFPEKPKAQKPELIRSPTKRYFLKGVVNALTGFRASHRKDAIGLFSGSMRALKNKAVESIKAPKLKKPVQDLTFRRASDLSYQC